MLINYDGINHFRYEYYFESGCIEVTTEIVYSLNDTCEEMEQYIMPFLLIPRFQNEMFGCHIGKLRQCIDSHYGLEEGILLRRYTDVDREIGWSSWENPSEEERDRPCP